MTKNNDFYIKSLTPKDFSIFSDYKKFNLSDFTFYEFIEGINFTLFIQKDKTYIESSKFVEEIVNKLNIENTTGIISLKSLFGIDIAVFGVYSKVLDKLYFYDIYLNNVWIKNDDFIEIMTKYKLPMAPVFNTKSFDEILKTKNNVYGVYGKSLIGALGQRNDKKVSFIYLKNDKIHLNIKNEIKDLCKKITSDDNLLLWNYKLNAMNIKKTLENKNEVLSIMVTDEIAKNNFLITSIAKKNGISEKKASDLVKKILPMYIIEKYLTGF